MKRDQKGFTIVELLIAVAILSIVIASVCGFILVGSRSYAAGNSDINVQQESQLALNQMSDVMIDTTRSVNYVGYDAGGNTETALKDAEFSFTPEDKSLILFNGVVEKDSGGGADTLKAGNGNKHYRFYWNKEKETLFYAEQNVVDTVVKSEDIINAFPDVADADPDADPEAAGWYKLASHVTDFSVDLSQLEEKRVVQLALTFTDGKKEYITSNNVTIRNKVGVNDVELAPLNRRVEIDIAVKPSVLLEPHEDFTLPAPTVTGKNVTDKSVEWSIVSAVDEDVSEISKDWDPRPTQFTDSANGMLHLSRHVKGSFKVRATTNAKNSDGNQAFADMTVYIKRVTNITLRKSADTNPANGAKEISPGCTFTVSAEVTGDHLGEVCDCCGEDTSIDKHILSTKNPFGVGIDDHRVWRVWSPWMDGLQDLPEYQNWHPEDHVKLISQDEYSATFYVEPDVPDGGTHKYVIQAVSLLSYYTPPGNARSYGWVMGDLDFTVVKNKTGVKPITGGLSYGTDNEENVHNEMKQDVLEKEIEPGNPKRVPESSFVTCVHVVDNSGEDPVKTLIHFSIGGGADFRIAPDLFDLDLEKSYTFYIQAMSPVSKWNLLHGDDHQADSAADIWTEYWANTSKEAPFDYHGGKYVYGDVYYGVLGKPTAIWNYNGNTYEGTDVTLDPVNVHMVGQGTAILSGSVIEPDEYKNIWHTARTWDKMTYSVYKEDDKGTWVPLYTFNGSDNVMAYEGSKVLGDGVGSLEIGDVPGRPGASFMKMGQGDKRKVAGNYHIVPGFCYDNIFDRSTKDYRIIGWDGFKECSYAAGKEFVLPHHKKYYKFDDSVIHVKLTSEFTMDINDKWWEVNGNKWWFEGSVNFPLPEEMLKNPTLFPNPYDMEWKSTTGQLKVEALPNGWETGTYMTFAYANYRYYSLPNERWEVEPVEVRIDTKAGKRYTHSYGTYVCGKNDSKWTDIKANDGSTKTENLVCNVNPFSVDNNSGYQAYFPLPTDAGFPFAKDVKQIEKYEMDYFDSNMQYRGKVSDVTVTCSKNAAQQYTIEFIKKEPDNQSVPKNRKIKVTSYGTYTWEAGETKWKRTDALGNRVSYETDFVANLENLKINGNSYKMYFPLPSESKFPFKNSGERISCTAEHVAYLMTDTYADGEGATEMQYICDIKYERSGDTHKITFVYKWDAPPLGTFICSQNGKKWTNE